MSDAPRLAKTVKLQPSTPPSSPVAAVPWFLGIFGTVLVVVVLGLAWNVYTQPRREYQRKFQERVRQDQEFRDKQHRAAANRMLAAPYDKGLNLDVDSEPKATPAAAPK